MAESGTSSLSFVLLIQMPDVTVANTVKQKIACHVLGVDSGTWMFIVVGAETHGGVNRSRSSVPRIDFHRAERAQQWVLKQMTGCEQKQGLLSLGSVGSGKHKHSNRKTRVAPKKINGAMHELKEYKSWKSQNSCL